MTYKSKLLPSTQSLNVLEIIVTRIFIFVILNKFYII